MGVQNHLRIQGGKFVINAGVMTQRGLYGVLNVIEEDIVMNVSLHGKIDCILKGYHYYITLSYSLLRFSSFFQVS